METKKINILRLLRYMHQVLLPNVWKHTLAAPRGVQNVGAKNSGYRTAISNNGSRLGERLLRTYSCYKKRGGVEEAEITRTWRFRLISGQLLYVVSAETSIQNVPYRKETRAGAAACLDLRCVTFMRVAAKFAGGANWRYTQRRSKHAGSPVGVAFTLTKGSGSSFPPTLVRGTIGSRTYGIHKKP